jgi:hypothetical protein
MLNTNLEVLLALLAPSVLGKFTENSLFSEAAV